MSKTFLILLIFSFLIINVSANVNITFQSDNEKKIDFFNIDNGYTKLYTNYSNTTNQTIIIPYNNFNVKLYAYNTHIQGNNGTFIIRNIEKVNDDTYLLIWLGIILGLCYIAYVILEKRI